MMMSIAWDKYQSEQSGFAPEELAILRPENQMMRLPLRKKKLPICRL